MSIGETGTILSHQKPMPLLLNLPESVIEGVSASSSRKLFLAQVHQDPDHFPQPSQISMTQKILLQ